MLSSAFEIMRAYWNMEARTTISVIKREIKPDENPFENDKLLKELEELKKGIDKL